MEFCPVVAVEFEDKKFQATYLDTATYEMILM